MRILLVKPYARLKTILGLERLQRLEPLELGYLAGAIPRDHEVRVLDLRLFRWPHHALSRALRRFGPDLVGFTAYSHESGAMKLLAADVRRLAPRAKIVVGGHHATVAPADCNVPQIDYIVRGEGCGPFRALVAALSRNAEPEGIPNLLLTGPRYDEAASAVWPRYPEPATVPTPRRDLWDWRDYYCVWPLARPKHWQSFWPRCGMMRTSYGCKMKCTFCVVPYLCGGEHRPRPIDVVVEELASIPADHVYFADDENFINEQHAHDLAEAIARRGIRKRLFAWARSTTVLRSPDLFRRWREVGLDSAFLGFEFPTDEQLRAVRKGATVAANEQAHRLLSEMGIAVHAGFMVRPEDSEADFERLRQYVAALPPIQCSFTVCTPSPGTADYEALRPRIWVPNVYDMHDCMHPMTPTALPLRRFGELIAGLFREAARLNPLRAQYHIPRPWELIRAIRAERRYAASFRKLYLEYPRELWDWKGSPDPAAMAAAGQPTPDAPDAADA